MRILHIVPTLASGGAERLLSNLVSHPAPNDDQIVVSLTAGEPFFDLSPARVVSLGLKRGQISPAAALRFRSIVRELRPDVVHAWMYHANLLSYIVARDGVPILWSIHNSDLPRAGTRRMTRAINHICARLSRRIPAAIVYAGDRARELHEGIGYDTSKSLVIPNGIDFQAFARDPVARRDLRRELGIADDVFLIGALARFDPQKDHATLLRAFATLRRTQNAQLVLAGADCTPSNPLITDLVGKLGIGESVRLVGPRSDAARLLSALDVLALPSCFGEAMPMVAIEAVAAELAIVGTDVGETGRFVVAPEFLTQPGDEEALAAALGHMATAVRSDELVTNLSRLRSQLSSIYAIDHVAALYRQTYARLRPHQG